MDIEKNRREALKAYQEKQDSIARLMQSIRKKLEAHDRQQDIDWASVGSLGYVEELLTQIDDFLG